MPLHDLSYKHWDGEHLGVWHRRWAITRNTLAAFFQRKWMLNLVVVCWGLGLSAALILFLVGQLLVPDSSVVKWASTFNPNLQTFIAMLTGWLGNHPEISIGATQNVLFYFLSRWLMRIAIFTLGLAIPALITRDLACKAIIIYSSKAISRMDYLLAKFAAVFILLSLIWTGPILGAWFLGNLLSPSLSFFWHARGALFNILTSGLTIMLVMSVLALAVSSLASKEITTTAFWYVWWILGIVIGQLALHTLPWLRHLFLNFNLDQITLAVFRVGDSITAAQDSIPVLRDMLQHNNRNSFIDTLQTPDLAGTWLALICMTGVGAWVVHKRVKPE